LPIYEYICTKCGDEFDAIQSFADKPLRKCTKCGGKLHKLVSECSFHLKGTGWYVTDYAKTNKSNEKAAHDKKAEKSKPESDKTKTDTDKTKTDTNESKPDTTKKPESKKTTSSKSASA
jgi:putative FmdB family regulatory protein